MTDSPSRLPVRLLPALALSALLTLTACSTVLGWFGRDNSDRNQTSIGGKRPPMANPNGSDPSYVDGTKMSPGAKKDETQPVASSLASSDNPYDLYDAKGTPRSPSAQPQAQQQANAAADSGGWFSRAPAKNPAYAERRRPVENVQAELGIDGSTAMAAPISPIDLGSPSNNGSLGTPAPLPMAPERRMAQAEPAPMPPLGPPAAPLSVPPESPPAPVEMVESPKVSAPIETPAPIALMDREIMASKPVPLPSGGPQSAEAEAVKKDVPAPAAVSGEDYPKLADTPAVPSRIEQFRKDRVESKQRMAALADEQKQADAARTELLGETGMGPASDTAMPASLPESDMASVPTMEEKPAPMMAEAAPPEMASMTEPSPATEEKRGIGGWFDRHFGSDAKPAPQVATAEEMRAPEQAVPEEKAMASKPAPKAKPEIRNEPNAMPAPSERMEIHEPAREERIEAKAEEEKLGKEKLEEERIEAKNAEIKKAEEEKAGEEKEFTAPAAERPTPMAEEEPILLRPPPGAYESPEMANAETPASDDAAQQEGFALRAPAAVAKTRFLADSRYAARRMAHRASSQE